MASQQSLKCPPLICGEAKADVAFQRFEMAAAALPALREHLAADRAHREFLRAIFSASPYLTELCQREPETVQSCLLDGCGGALEAALEVLPKAMAECADQNAAMRALRIAKRRIALTVAIADLAGWWTVDEATDALSRAADALLREAVRFLLGAAARKGQFLPPAPERADEGSGYIVLAMGKHGAHELNYSSDIDLIVLFDRETAPLSSGVEAGQFFVRITRDLVKLLQERTPDGYVFRTDLRLRPDPGSTQVALSTAAAGHYYESAGQNWERAAFIKARAAAGDLHAGERFLRSLTPYVWRKYLDFAAIADVHAMKRQIHAHKGHGAVAVEGHNVKLGRGGIREVEFFAQTQQLIAGGRQPELRCKGTLEALRALAARGWITQAAAGELTEAYRFLRRIEHRLQMINDEQTHTLPADADGLYRVARFSGFEDTAGFAAALAGQLRCVERHYAALFETVPELTAEKTSGSLVFTGNVDDPDTLETLKRMGFTSPAAAIDTVKGWHFGRYAAMRSARARELLTELAPALLEALSRTFSPDQALASFDRFLAELPAGVQLFSLLRNHPKLLDLIADIAGSAPRLAHTLSKRRNVIDALIDPVVLESATAPEQYRELAANFVGGAGNYEEALNLARRFGQEQQFLIGARILSGAIEPQRAGEAYALLAESLIAALQAQVETLMASAHGVIPGGQAAVLAMGKLGGREMTASSDLDLILIYEASGESTGLKPLPGMQYYSRYTQRLISALSAGTGEGHLYEVDMRLRPSGNSGPVATSLSSFMAYQANEAWTWEHMALTRARAISGPAELRGRLAGVIGAVLSRPRDAAKTARDVRDMRDKIAAHKGTSDPWDLKQVRGGLLDVEFIAQYLQLMHAAETPGVLKQNTLEALTALGEAGHLDVAAASALTGAARFYQALTQMLRLCTEGVFDPATAPAGVKARLAQAAGAPDFARAEAELRERLAEVARLFDVLIPPGD